MVREIMIALVTVWTLDVSANAAAAQPDRPTDRSADAALRYFESVQHADFDALLRQLRQPAPSPADRAMVIRNLPKQGELTPTRQEATKLEALQPVLALHGREQDMEFRLVTVGGLALAALHARTVPLMTREALTLLDRDELQAVIAHELGHDYIWNEYEEARQQGNHRLLQELELRCDVVAVMTMERLRVDSERLLSAATKLARYNQHLMGRPLSDARYVPLKERVQFIRAVARLKRNGAPARR
jgi:hypothetical protein